MPGNPRFARAKNRKARAVARPVRDCTPAGLARLSGADRLARMAPHASREPCQVDSVLLEWSSLILRWLHVIAAMAWIGTSFYFIALDAGLQRRPALPEGVAGEAWQVHGGGFYRMWKYTVAPPELPEKLTWFMWEAYTTWISGFLLMLAYYYWNAELLLVDPAVLDLSAAVAIGTSIAVLVVGYLSYETLCRSPLGRSDLRLAAVGSLLIVLVAWLLSQIFSGRAAVFHLGALLGTIMAANVGHVIIPNQRKVVAALIAGRDPDPVLGRQAKQRSLHNNYLTLPVVFFMIANHYPLVFATGRVWLVAALVLLAGFSVRHFFNARHRGERGSWWSWATAALAMAALAWLTLPQAAARNDAPADADLSALAREIVETRCSMCHSAEPVWEGIVVPPRGVRFDDPRLLRLQAQRIALQAVWTRAMPPANVTGMTEQERALLGRWAAGEIGR